MKSITEAELIDFFKTKIASEMGISEAEINENVEFINFGMDSVNAIFILQHLEKFLGIELNPLLFWDYPTIKSFSQYVISNFQKN